MFNLQQRNYVFSAIDDKSREQALHKSVLPRFRQIINLILDRYGLAERLEEAKATGHKVFMLDLGCSEGLYLHDLAQLLEERGLLEGASLHGIDKNPAHIATAQEYTRLAKPARPYLNFYFQDGLAPFSENLEMRLNNATQFDLIFSLITFMYIADAEATLAKVYEQDLKPGGVLYLRDLANSANTTDILTMHPSLNPMLQFFKDFLTSLNPNGDVATESANWLRQYGAETVEVLTHIMPASGKNEGEMGILRTILLMCRSVGQQMVARGMLTQTDFDERFATIYRELDKDSQGHLTYVDTIAQKPGV